MDVHFELHTTSNFNATEKSSPSLVKPKVRTHSRNKRPRKRGKHLSQTSCLGIAVIPSLRGSGEETDVVSSAGNGCLSP